MVFFRLSLAAAAVAFATAAYAYSDEAVKDAETLVQMTKDRYAAGEVTAADGAKAQIFFLRMKLEAGQMPRAVYCGSALPNAQSIVMGYENEMRMGQRTIEDL